jgi:hypothetical protein
MSDDLVKQLRTASGDACRCGTPVCLEAADRIETLEAALWRHACKCTTMCDGQCLHWNAKLALEGEND